MWFNTALFAAGIFLCQQLEVLPGLYWSVAILLLSLSAILLVICHPDKPAIHVFRLPAERLLPVFLFGLGFGWAIIFGQWKLSDRLAHELIKKPLTISGSVIELPRHNQRNWQFVFETETAEFQGKTVEVPARIMLGWYKTDNQLLSGQRWRLNVKLKPPTGLLNPGLFDYEGWLFQQGIGARGYVIASAENQLLKHSSGLSGFDVLREKIRHSLARYNQYPAASALVTALTVGDKSSITLQSWDSFRKLGINHLVAISGLHVGMVVMLIYWVSGRFWRLFARACEWIPAPQVQALSGLVAALFYAGLAGFSLPTQRALIMLSVVLLARIFLINLQSFKQLAVAVFMVLFWDPHAIVSPGFWLSFMAVSAIFLSVGEAEKFSQPQQNKSLLLKIKNLVSMQWSITLLLLPFSLLFFKQVSVVSPLANLVLIPLFSFIVVPVALLMTFLDQLDVAFIEMLFVEYLAFVTSLLNWLEKISAVDWFVFQTSQIGTLRFLLLLLSAIVWFARVLRFRRMLAVVLLAVALFYPAEKHKADELHLSVLDIGQGTAILLETADKVLLYDLGPRYGYGRSATASVVIPYLQNKGISKIDLLVISHSDSDHAGDIEALLDTVRVEKIIAGERLDISRDHDLCQSGQHWLWQQTGFEFLSPVKHPVKDNNASCVLRVAHGNNHLLLTGDIEKTIESSLLKTSREKLQADVVLVPHHGSKSSSTAEFVEAVNARIVINSSGYLNRYGFPNKQVKSRWLENGAMFLDTAEQGALELVLAGRNDGIFHSGFMQQNGKYWHWRRQNLL
jgi:competence protein ComEC